MKSRAIIPLVLGLGVGIFAIKMFVSVLQNAKGAANSAEIQVVVAVTDIAPGVEITDAMVSMRTVPEEFMPKMGYTAKDELLGRVVGVAIANGSPVTSNALAPVGTPPGLAVRIPDGFRAVAVKIDEYAGVAGWLKPQTRVDVIAMTTYQDGKYRKTSSRSILSDVEVLAVGQDAGESGDPAAAVTRSVTLLVRPDDVPKLHLAASLNGSKLRLAMRGQSSKKVAVATADNVSSGAIGTAGNVVTQDEKPSILTRLLGKWSEKGDQTADKDADDQPVAAPAETPEPESEWHVTVNNGNGYQDLRFSNSSRSARLLLKAEPVREKKAVVVAPVQEDERSGDMVYEVFGAEQSSKNQ